MARKLKQLEQIAAAAGMNPDVVDKLNNVLTGPTDRAYVVCEFLECTHNIKGHCAIYTVQDVPRMKTGKPCDRYEARM
jgi:hypothetical protein